MNPRVKKLILEQREQERLDRQAERERILTELGLLEEGRIYVKNPNMDRYTASRIGYDQFEVVDGVERYYRVGKIPMELSDDEFALVYDVYQKRKQLETPPARAWRGRSRTSSVFHSFAWITWIGGLVYSILAGLAFKSFGMFLGIFSCFIYAGSVPMAVSKILDALERIADTSSGTNFTFQKKK